METVEALAAKQNRAIYGDGFVGQEAYFDYRHLRTLLETVPKGGRLLEVGSGTGAIACRLAREGEFTILGMDSDPDRVRLAIQNAFRSGMAERVRFVAGDMDKLSSSTLGSYDAVYSLDSLQFSTNLSELLSTLTTATRAKLVGTLWCCHCPELAALWGFPRAWHRDEAATALRSVRRDALFWDDKEFPRRFYRYLRFLRAHARALEETLGVEAFLSRLRLIERSAQAAERSELVQLVFSLKATESP